QASGTIQGLNGVHFLDANTGTAVGWSGTILHTTNGGASWTPQNSGTIGMLNDVYFTDANHGIVTGLDLIGNNILRTTNGGATWAPQSTSSGQAWTLDGISFAGNNGYAVGSLGTIARTSDGGITWSEQS
ncbi:MAG: hypothetical protein KDG51_18525, partial [Calditrichaeota bacterium]|nr:hypothetical protein [Calditrichota bacterium]